MTPFLAAAIAEMLPNAGAADGCAECGFAWSIDGGGALRRIQDAAGRFDELLRGRDATRAPSPNVWSPSAYVWHVGDVARAWSERLHTLGVDPGAAWAGFDPDELGRARRYDELPQATGPWALARAVDAVTQVLEDLDLDRAFLHPEWGHGTVADALRWVAHEAVHHELDVRRGLERVDVNGAG
jgi:hypothetical protein